MKQYIVIIICIATFYSFTTQAQDQQLWTSGRPDGHGPIGVMGDHTHSKGEFMLSYRFMQMSMEDMRNEGDRLSQEDVLANFMVTPLRMPMNMHMFGAMYAVSDRLTLMGMVNILDISMDHVSRMGAQFTTTSAGIGDIRLAGLLKVMDQNNQRLHINLGLSIPSGSIDEMDVTPASTPNESLLPYPMQLGSGTWDLLPGLTYLAQGKALSFGAQVMGTVRLGENDRTYTLGSKLSLTSWGAIRLTDWISTSVRIKGDFSAAIQGGDPTYAGMINMSMVPTVFTENFGGSHISTGLGINLLVPDGTFKDLRLAAEIELPIYRSLNGPQLEMDEVITVGIQYAF